MASVRRIIVLALAPGLVTAGLLASVPARASVYGDNTIFLGGSASNTASLSLTDCAVNFSGSGDQTVSASAVNACLSSTGSTLTVTNNVGPIVIGTDINGPGTADLVSNDGSVFTASTDPSAGPTVGTIEGSGSNGFQVYGSFSTVGAISGQLVSVESATALKVTGAISNSVAGGVIELGSSAGVTLFSSLNANGGTYTLESATTETSSASIGAGTVDIGAYVGSTTLNSSTNTFGTLVVSSGGAPPETGPTTVATSRALTISTSSSARPGDVTTVIGALDVSSGALTIATPISSTGPMTFTAPSVTESGSGSIGMAQAQPSSQELDLVSSGAVTLSGTNTIATLGGSAGSVTLDNSRNLSLTNLDVAGGNVLVTTTSGGISQTSGALIAASVQAVSAGPVTLNQSGNVINAFGATSGNNSAVTLVDGLSGPVVLNTINAGTGTVSIQTIGSVAQNTGQPAVITAGTLTGSSHGDANFGAGNSISSLGPFTVSGGKLTVRTSLPLSVGGAVTAGSVVLAAPSLAQSATSPISATQLSLAITGNADLTGTGNQVGTYTGQVGSANIDNASPTTVSSLASQGALSVAAPGLSVASTLSAAGTLTLSSTQAGASGALTLQNGSSLSGSSVRLFSPSRELTTVGSNLTINGANFTPGVEYRNTATEQWATTSASNPTPIAPLDYSFYYADQGTDATSLAVDPMAGGIYGNGVTMTATVTPAGAAGGSATGPFAAPTGTVEFDVDSQPVLCNGTQTAVVPLTNSPGTTGPATATCLYAGLTTGGHTLAAVYHPDTNTAYPASNSSGLSYAVGRATPVVSTVTAVDQTADRGANTAFAGDTVQLSATVAGSASGATPTGTITFATTNGTLSSSCQNATVTDGTASCTTTLAPGSESLSATFTPDAASSANYNGAMTASPTALVVDSAPSITTSSLPAAIVGTYYNAPVQVSDGYPAGTTVTVTGLPNGLAYDAHSGEIVGIPTQAVDGSAKIVASNSAGLSDTRTLELRVAPASTGTTLSFDQSSVQRGTAVVATAVVSPPPDGGSVQFSVDGADVGLPAAVDVSSGKATIRIDTSGLSEGSHTVLATYSGTSDYDSSNDRQTLTVTAVPPPPVVGPTITASTSSSVAKTSYGWWRKPVTVTFSCVAGSGAVTCPSPFVVRHNGRHTVTRTITASDGGTATVSIDVKVDLVAPLLSVTGARDGVHYAKKQQLSCHATDKLSGVASCDVTQTRRAAGFGWIAAATDKAGNTATERGGYLLTK